MDAARPGIASADRPRSGPFAELVARITHDSSALDALAFAYGELGTEERRGLIRAVIQDVDEPCEALGVLLAVEADRALAGELAGLLRRYGRTVRCATLERRADRGEACLLRSGLGFTGELLRIVWNDNQIESIELEPETAVKSWCSASPASVPVAVEVIAPLLWRHLRAGGPLPEGIERFAAFFSVS